MIFKFHRVIFLYPRCPIESDGEKTLGFEICGFVIVEWAQNLRICNLRTKDRVCMLMSTFDNYKLTKFKFQEKTTNILSESNVW